MALPQTELVTAMMTKYRADATLRGLIVGASAPEWGIFDSVPTNEVFPYAVVNDISAVIGTALTFDYNAHDLLVQIDVYSQYQGFNEARAIASRIDTLTNRQSFAMTDFNNFFTLFNNSFQKVEPDGITRRVMLEYKYMTQGG
jgi:Protein of unknown function (DUF3168)